jgi:hypothetical protein
MKQIDIEPRNHSSSYEIKPMSPWLLTPAIGMLALGIWLNGWNRAETWGLIVGSALFFGGLPMVFPKQLLSKPKD